MALLLHYIPPPAAAGSVVPELAPLFSPSWKGFSWVCWLPWQTMLLFLGGFFQCTTRRSSTGTSSLPTCSWEMMATSKLPILESAISLKGMMPSFPARQGHQPSWHRRPSHRLAKVSVERWVFAHSWHLLGPPSMAQRAVPHLHPDCGTN